jgi:universal stress protein A
MTTILVATDFSAAADRALGEAISLARALGAALEIMHVHPLRNVPVPPVLDVAVVTPRPADLADAEAALATRARQVGSQGLPVTSYSAFGAPAEQVVRRAQDIGALYIALGRHGHRPLTEVLLGSVAERIVRHAPCPLLVVPPGAV